MSARYQNSCALQRGQHKKEKNSAQLDMRSGWRIVVAPHCTYAVNEERGAFVALPEYTRGQDFVAIAEEHLRVRDLLHLSLLRLRTAFETLELVAEATHQAAESKEELRVCNAASAELLLRAQHLEARLSRALRLT